MAHAAGSGPWVAVEHADGTTSGFGLQDVGAATDAGTSPGTVSGTGTGVGDRADGLPLAGVRVLDLTRVIAGPVATRLLAALGAEVLRIDPPAFPEIEDQFVDTAFGKRSAVLDLGPAANRQNLQQLLAGADAVVTGYRHGALDRFGLNPRELLAAHPGLVVVTLDSWGGSGPWSGLRGFDSIVQAASGIAHLYGREDDYGRWRPGALPVQALDHATGYGVAAAAVGLLAARRRTGLGGAAHLSLARTAEELFSLTGMENQAGREHGAGTESQAGTENQATTASPAELPSPEYRSVDSSFGELRYVGPPLLDAGRPLDYQSPPPPYGSSPAAWL